MRFTLTMACALYCSALAAAFVQQPSATPAPPSARFDMEVRADFFAGFSGDSARFARAMARCEEVLALNPNHPEALVWHGSGLISQAAALFAGGDMPKGMELYGRGLGEMERAVSLAPDHIGVRIPRGATLFEASRHVPPAQQAGLLKLALDDYEHALRLQQATFASLSDHAKGELLFGLAEGWARAGDKDKAQEYFTRLTKDASGSGRVTYAKAWLDGAPPASPGRCVGCH
jgi:tetratricopeptide (TPR) repeat protein